MTKINLPNWRFDNWSNKEPEELLDQLEDLINLLRLGRKIMNLSSFSDPSGEVIFTLLKELSLYASSLFGREHRNILRRNPELKLFYAPTIFHTLEGKRSIDTGLPRSIKIEKHPTKFLIAEEFLQEYFMDLTQEFIELEKAYINQKLSHFRRSTKVLKDSGSKTEKVRLLRTEIDSLKFQIRELTHTIHFWRHCAQRRTLRKPRKKGSSHNPKR